MEQLLGSVGGARAGGGPHQFGRDLREALPRSRQGCCCNWTGDDQEGSIGTRAEGKFESETIGADFRRLRIARGASFAHWGACSFEEACVKLAE